MKPINHVPVPLVAAAAISIGVLVGCGGGGDGGSPAASSASNPAGTPTPSSAPTTGGTAVPGTLPTAQYASGSAQLAAFTLLNQYRTQCGFPALQQNTVLDRAAQNHAKYMATNNAFVDSEDAGKAGFTGTTYVTRAQVAGYPNGAFGFGASGGYIITTNGFSASSAGEKFVYSLLGGVYHSAVVAYPMTTVGLGEAESQSTNSGFQYTNSYQALNILNTTAASLLDAPRTFPCQGVEGVPNAELTENPTPPNVSANGWGTPVVVMGNVTDSVRLQAASITGPAGAVTIQILDSTTDPNKQLTASYGVVYPTAPLSPNTRYSVSVSGTINGAPFSRNFTFTTGNAVG